MYKPSSPDSKLLDAPKACNVSVISGYNSTKDPTDAVIILAEPTPDAIANAYGCKKVEVAKILAIKPINIVPTAVPTIYTPNTPSPSFESRPYFSPINATFGSLAIE